MVLERVSMATTMVHSQPKASSLTTKKQDVETGAQTAVAHTLTACTRCRTRKTRCDPCLPKCGPCQRTNSICEYYDSNKGRIVNRNYVVHLQHRVKELEEELEKLENEDGTEDPEAMMRAATVRMHDAQEVKFLGPSSGIAVTRLVMQLAKQFTDSKSIRDIVPDNRAAHSKSLFSEEQAKPTSKVYPVTSNVAAPDMPERGLAEMLLQLYKLKVQPMYPALHEPTLERDFNVVYDEPEKATSFQNLVVRMVIAISLQKMSTQYAGLADSFYLAALKYMESVVRKMDIGTLQCWALMAEYSLLTPTRTAIYFVMGMAVRLIQSLGYHEEKTIQRGQSGAPATALEVDMRRRIFWCIFVMECGLAHSLGRPAMLASRQENIDVEWFALCDDSYISDAGIDHSAPLTLKKWIAVHFFKMRLLQLEIRRKLYLKKRETPKDETDPWFVQMETKMNEWRDASPDNDEGIGLDKVWFIGRYNTMVVFLYRPSPQLPRPSLSSALKVFAACEFNIGMQREQITRGNVDLTWIFTQSLFMAISAMLWSLSYAEVRRKHSQKQVESLLDVAMEGIQLASERWPGVTSAIQLYQNLIAAIMKIYQKDGDVPISATTPSDAPSPSIISHESATRSRTTSPATVASSSIATPSDRAAPPPFTSLNNSQHRMVEQQQAMPFHNNPSPSTRYTAQAALSLSQPLMNDTQIPMPEPSPGLPSPTYDSYNHFNTLPEFEPELTVPGWNNMYNAQQDNASYFNQAQYAMNSNMQANFASMQHQQAIPMQNQSDYTPQFWDLDASALNAGLTQTQQQELMQTFQSQGMDDIQHMITSSLAAMTPKPVRSEQQYA